MDEERMRATKLVFGCLVLCFTLWGCSDIKVGGPVDSSCSADSDCTEGKECTTGSCSGGECSYDITANWCFVQGSCFQPGQELPGDRCQTCDPTLIQSGLVKKQCPEGEACNSATGECEAPPQEDTVAPDTTLDDVVGDATGPADTSSDTSADSVEPDLPPAVVPTCDQYCGVYMQTCGNVSEYIDAAECVSYCNTYAGIPAGTTVDKSGNTIGCRWNQLKEAAGAAGEVAKQEACVAAGRSGGNVCGTWCENYCHLAIKNCSGEPTYFETFNECKVACAAFPEDGIVGEKTGDTVQCRIYHLGVAGDDLSGGAAMHCPHGSIAGTGGCEPVEEDLCKSYCAEFFMTCPEEVLEGQAYVNEDDCLGQCGKVPQDGQMGVSTGYTVQCLKYHVSQAKGKQAKEHCINAAIGSGSVCVEGPKLRITELAPYHANPFTGQSIGYIEVMNVGVEPYVAKNSLFIHTQGLSAAGEFGKPTFSPIKGFQELSPGQRFILVSPGNGSLPVPGGTIVIEAEMQLDFHAGLVALIEGNGYFEVVTYGGDEVLELWTKYFDSEAWDYPGKPAPKFVEPYALSRCPEDQDTDDGSDFLVTPNTLAEPNNCDEVINKDDKQPPMPGG